MAIVELKEEQEPVGIINSDDLIAGRLYWYKGSRGKTASELVIAVGDGSNFDNRGWVYLNTGRRFSAAKNGRSKFLPCNHEIVVTNPKDS